MREHINSLNWDTLEKVFREITNTVGWSNIKGLVQNFLDNENYTILSMSNETNSPEYWVRISVNGELFDVFISMRPLEDSYILDLKLSLFYFYPDGWIDLPD